MPWKIAEKNVRCWKGFVGEDGSRGRLLSPVQGHDWGRLKKGKALISYLDDCDDDCCGIGVHAALSRLDAAWGARQIGNCGRRRKRVVVWQCIIPKGERYHESSREDAQTYWYATSRGYPKHGKVRARRIVLVRKVYDRVVAV
jgi:hypothetical protein